jgi:hypothetical protein
VTASQALREKTLCFARAFRLPRDRVAIRGSDRRKNHRSASIFAAKEYEMPLKSSGFRITDAKARFCRML